METEKNIKGFPDPTLPFATKLTDEFGLAAAEAISGHWFGGGFITTGTEFWNRREYVRKKRLFVRGEIDASYFKNHMSKGDNDLNFLNLDWSNINWAEKFCRIVSNGLSDKNFKLDVRATDKLTAIRRGEKQDYYLKYIKNREMAMKAEKLLGQKIMPEGIPEDEEEMHLRMKIKDRPKIEIAEEKLIDYVLKTNEWEYLAGVYDKDIVDSGLMVARVYIDKNDGVKVQYVDCENYIHSRVNKNDFSDKYYEGVVDTITLSDYRRETGCSDAQLREVAKAYGPMNQSTITDYTTCSIDNLLDFKLDVLRFAFKTSKTITYKQKLRKGKPIRVDKRDESYEAPKRSDVSKLSESFDTWMEGNYVIGTKFIYDYKECENVYSDVMNKATSPFITRAYDIYENRLRSFTDNIEGPVRQLQKIHLKLQHLISELKPDMIRINIDQLAEIDLGGSNKKSWENALTLMGAKGAVFVKTVNLGEDGISRDAAAEPMPLQQGSALTILLNVWAHYYNLIRENTGVNPARDGSLPADSLVGVNQMAQLASNTVTANIVEASQQFKKKICEVISIRLHTIFRYKEAAKVREIYEQVIGKEMLDAVEVLKDRHLHEFAFTFEMVPTADDIKEFNEALNLAIQEGNIDVETVLQARQLAKVNTKEALEYLQYKRRKRLQQAQQEAEQNARVKAENDMKSAQAAKMADAEAYNLKKQADLQYAKQLAEIELFKAQALQQITLPEKEREFQEELMLKKLENAGQWNKITYQEDRKDERTGIQATQQSKMKEQAMKNGRAIDFENNDKWFLGA